MTMNLKKMPRSVRALRAVALAACAMALPAAAIESAGTPVPENALSPPRVQERGNVRYIMGGVGVEGRAQLARRTEGMNLQLVFAQAQTGALYAMVDVRIVDPQGQEVLKLDQADPMVFAQLEPGTYSVKATTREGTVERRFKVPEGGLHREVVLWG